MSVLLPRLRAPLKLAAGITDKPSQRAVRALEDWADELTQRLARVDVEAGDTVIGGVSSVTGVAPVVVAPTTGNVVVSLVGVPTGSGTTNVLPIWTSPSTLGNSPLSTSGGSAVTAAGSVIVLGQLNAAHLSTLSETDNITAPAVAVVRTLTGAVDINATALDVSFSGTVSSAGARTEVGVTSAVTTTVSGGGTITNVAGSFTASGGNTNVALRTLLGDVVLNDTGGTTTIKAATTITTTATGFSPPPNTLLKVEGSTASNPVCISMLATGRKVISFGNATSGDDGRIEYDAVGRDMRLRTAGTVAVSIDSAQAVTLNAYELIKGTPTVNNDGLTLGFIAPNGIIASKNSSGAPASNLYFRTTDTGGAVNDVMTLGFDRVTTVIKPALVAAFAANIVPLVVKETGTQQANLGGGIQFEGAYNSTLTTHGALIKMMKTNGSDGDYSFDLALGTRFTGETDPVEHLRIKDTGAILMGDTTSTAVRSNVDVLTIGNTGTGQTTDAKALVRAEHTGSLDTTSGPLDSYAVKASATATRSAGGNNLTNIGVMSSAANGQLNFSFYGVAGTLFNAGDVTTNANLACGGNLTAGNASGDTHFVNGNVTFQNPPTAGSIKYGSLQARIYIKTQAFTAGGTYTPSTNAKACKVRMVAGGGGGGGCNASNGGAGGGAAGGYFEKWIDASANLSGGTVTIGAAGAAGSTSGGNGGTGGDSSVVVNGTTYTAKGGLGGVGTVSLGGTAVALGGVGGTGGSAGDVNFDGQPGKFGLFIAGSLTVPGGGGNNPLGSGGGEAGNTTSANGLAASGYGGGGGGGVSVGTAKTGGVGTAGIVIIEEYA